MGHRASGRFVESVGWRWIFLLNVPIVAVALLYTLRFTDESKDAGAPNLDWSGLLLLTAGLAALVTGLLHLREWGSPLDAAVLGGAALLLAGSSRSNNGVSCRSYRSGS